MATFELKIVRNHHRKTTSLPRQAKASVLAVRVKLPASFGEGDHAKAGTQCPRL